MEKAPEGTSKRAPTSLPPFAEPYRAHFEEIHRALDLYEGFALLPIEVPSVDVGTALCRWLEDQGHQVRVIAPKEGEWHLLAPTLLSLPVDERGLVVVLGPQRKSEDLAVGLNRLNLKRDTLARHLGRPLLWCGPRDFLDTTWETAPDFWSIREITIRISRIAMGDTGHVAGGGPWIEPTPEPELVRAQLEVARRTKDEPNRARLLLQLARSLLARGHLADAETALNEATSLIARIPSFRRSIENALCLETRGDIDWGIQNARRAEPSYQSALKAYNDLGDMHGSARMMGKLGRVAFRLSDWEAAASWFEKALSTSAGLGDATLRAHLLQARGRFRYLRDDHRGALQDLDEALRLFRLVDDRRGQADTLKVRGDIKRREEDLGGALADYDAALSLFRAVESRLGQANVLLARGALRYRQANVDGASADYDSSLSLFESAGDRLGQAYVLRVRGDLRRLQKDPDGAIADYDAALSLFRAVEDSRGQAHILLARGNLEVDRGRYDAALEHSLKALSLYEITGSSYDLSGALARIADIHRLAGRSEEARAAAERARELALRGHNANALQLAENILSAR